MKDRTRGRTLSELAYTQQGGVNILNMKEHYGSPMANRTTGLSIPQETKERLRELARIHCRSLSHQVTHLIEQAHSALLTEGE